MDHNGEFRLVIKPKINQMVLQKHLSLEKTLLVKDHVALILGDNIFNGIDFSVEEIQQFENQNGAKVFVYEVPDPERYGVAEIKMEMLFLL